MTPETPPSGPSPERPRGDPHFGPESAASVERSLTQLKDPDDALRLLAAVEENGAAFAAYLMLEDTDLSDVAISERFHDSYVDAWERSGQFRSDVLEALGWTDALAAFMTEQGIPPGHLTWSHAEVDARIHETYELVHLDGWWHAFYR